MRGQSPTWFERNLASAPAHEHAEGHVRLIEEALSECRLQPPHSSPPEKINYRRRESPGLAARHPRGCSPFAGPQLARRQ